MSDAKEKCFGCEGVENPPAVRWKVWAQNHATAVDKTCDRHLPDLCMNFAVWGYRAVVENIRVLGRMNLVEAEAVTEAEGVIGEDPELCEYSARHRAEGVPATQMLVCGPLGKVPACDECAAVYASLKAR